METLNPLAYLTRRSYSINDLQRKVEGISSLILSRSLKEFEGYSLVIRHQYNEIPPRVEYELSDLGQNLTVVMKSLGE